MTWYGRAIVRAGGSVAIAVGAVALLVGAMGGSRPTQMFVPWGVAYLLLGLLIILAARKI
jgi:hypothetical protein